MKKILSIFIIALFILLIIPIVKAQIIEWKLDEGSEETASDSIGNNDGTIIGATWETTDCIQGNCLSFDGIDDYVDIAADDSYNFDRSDSFSVSFWIYPKELGVLNGVIGKFGQIGSKVSPYYYIFLDRNNKMILRFYNSTSKTGVQNFNSLFTVSSEWTHLTVTWNTTDGCWYKNGEFDSCTTNTISGSIASLQNLNIGTIGLGQRAYRFNGLIDEVKIYNSALTDQEIQDIYNAEKPAVALDCSTITKCEDYTSSTDCILNDPCKTNRLDDDSTGPTTGCYYYTDAYGVDVCEYCGFVGSCSDYPTETACTSIPNPCGIGVICSWDSTKDIPCYKPFTDQGNDCTCPEGTTYGKCIQGFQTTTKDCTCTLPDGTITDPIKLKVPCRVTKKFPFFSPISIILALILLVGYYIITNKRQQPL